MNKVEKVIFGTSDLQNGVHKKKWKYERKTYGRNTNL